MRNKRYAIGVRWIIPLLLLVWGATSCITFEGAGGNPGATDEIRFQRFEEYYARGRNREIAGDFTGAREDFETCLGLRGVITRTRKLDDWRVRTHGMHMLDGYFPNRELGIAFFHLGDHANARKFLELSMQQTPTDRASFFINKVNEAGARAQPMAPPAIELAGPPAFLVNSQEFRVQGIAKGDARIKEVQVGDAAHYIELAAAEQKIDQSVALKPGVNEIKVKVTDLKNQVREARMQVTADFSPPGVRVKSAREQNGKILLLASALDNYGLASLSLDGKPLPLMRGSQETEIQTLVEPTMRGSLVARDLAGNERQWKLSDLVPGQASTAVKAPVRLLFHPDRENYRVHEPYFYFDGVVEADAGLDRVELNGSGVITRALSDRSGHRFEAFKSLKPGVNRFEFIAVDGASNTAGRVIQVEYLPPAYVKLEHRLGASVLPMHSKHKSLDSGDWRARVVNALINRESKRFNLINTELHVLEARLQEAKLEVAGLIDPRGTIDYRRFNDADLSLNGQLVKHREGVELRFRIVDTHDPKRYTYVDLYIDDTDSDAAYKLQGLLSKIERHFPVVSGKITKVAGNTVYLDKGLETGMFTGNRLLVIAPGPDGNMRSGVLRETGNARVELVARKITNRQATAGLLEKSGNTFLQPGDYFYSR